LSSARESSLRWLLTDEFSDDLDDMDPMWRLLGACIEVDGLSQTFLNRRSSISR
jgi:hypothetical protein